MSPTKTAKPTLPTFEDMNVNTATVRITNAGDGLSEALKMDPKALHLGQSVFYVLAGDVTQINHVDKDDVLTRVHTVKASAITEVEREVAEKMLQAAAEDLQRRKDEIEGQLRLDAESAATEREKQDATSAPTDIAAPAAKRVRNGD